MEKVSELMVKGSSIILSQRDNLSMKDLDMCKKKLENAPKL